MYFVNWKPTFAQLTFTVIFHGEDMSKGLLFRFDFKISYDSNHHTGLDKDKSAELCHFACEL